MESFLRQLDFDLIVLASFSRKTHGNKLNFCFVNEQNKSSLLPWVFHEKEANTA